MTLSFKIGKAAQKIVILIRDIKNYNRLYFQLEV